MDGFFAISGFLIVASWMRTPDWRRYLRARVLRIMPAFWVCLAVTALVIAPLTTGAFGQDNLGYIAKNAALWVFQYDIAGTPAGVPYDAVWNGSLWPLAWEFSCYLGVMLLGLTGMLRRRATLPVLFALALTGACLTSAGLIHNNYIVLGSRFGLMFLAGSLIWQYQHRLPVGAPLIAFAVAVIVMASFLPNYRIFAALPLAYLILLCGALIRAPWLRFSNHISYGVYIYAFPLQQVLALAHAYDLGIPTYAVLTALATLPVATLSWFLVERPIMRLSKRSLALRHGNRAVPSAAEA